MNDKGRIALSSLAVSASVSAILSISPVAHADPPLGYCNVGPSCSLGWTADQGTYEGAAEGYIGYGDDWHYVEGTLEQGYGDTHEGGHFDYGTCGFNNSSPPACGCGGVKARDIYSGVPAYYNEYAGDGNPFYLVKVPNWYPPYSGVAWTYEDTQYDPVFYPVGSGPTGSYECWTSD